MSALTGHRLRIKRFRPRFFPRFNLRRHFREIVSSLRSLGRVRLPRLPLAEERYSIDDQIQMIDQLVKKLYHFVEGMEATFV